MDDRPIGDGDEGHITKQLRQAYLDIVQGKNPAYDKWLDYVT